MKELVTSTFNKLAHIYETNIDTNGLYNSEYERPAMMKHIQLDLRDKTVLDAGCAAGWYTLQLTNRGASVVATDISPEMVSATKRRVGDNTEVICLDLEKELPFEDATFDLIISSLTLHYLKNWDQTFREFQRVLKKNGQLLFSVHHPHSDIKILRDPHYFKVELIIDKWKKEGRVYDVPYYRRPLQYIINSTLNHFNLEEVIEPEPTLTFKQKSPESYKRLMSCPQFIIMKARKV
ncbi:class I SAM-dependent methyltransferase [Bacillus sp. BGMRC 2118]|nr:class I SAM-dependent methyltransferase [Bacillus sp. BGMRC 2118]